MAFINTKYANHSDDFPDIQIFMAAYADSSDGGLFSKRVASLTDEFYAAVFEENLYKEAFTTVPLLLRPKSRGNVFLKNKDPNEKILINPNYFSHPDDIKVLVSNCKFTYLSPRVS